MTMTSLTTVVGIGLLGIAGCATVPRDSGFGDVQREVAGRTGQRVTWNRGTSADRAVDAAVRSLLSEGLGANEAVQIALLNNRDLQATYENLMIAQADLVEAGLLSNPVFDTQIWFFESGTGGEGAVVQNFLEILYLPLRRRMAAARFEATKLRVAGEVLDLAGETRMAFYELQGAQQAMEMRRQVLIATEASFDLAQRMRRAGNLTELDVANERSLYEQSKVNVAVAEAQVTQRRERLNELMGLWGGQTDWRVAARLPEPPQDSPSAQGMERRAIERSLDLAAARHDIEAAARVLGITRPFAAVPAIDAGVTGKRETSEFGLGPALSLSVPLFNQGQPAIAKARSELRRAQQHYTGLAVTIRARVRAAQSALSSARDRAVYYREVILPVRQQIVEQTQLHYNAMQVGPFQLLLAKQQQIDAASEYIETLEEYWLAKSELDQILAGRLAQVERRQPAEAWSAAGIIGGAMNGQTNSPGN